MDATNQQKLLNAGFTIIRDEARHISGINYECKIKAKTPLRKEWYTLEKGFGSVAMMTRRVKELLEDKYTVKD